ncbi:MAG: hypothetical protein PHX13_12400 [Thiovulaceae bacterium]|nr:hypothetical protein [Sulfurimonadaceae bacterium]
MPEQIESDAEKFSGGYFREQLNFSDEQMDMFRGFNPRFRRDARAITIELADLRKKMLNEMAANNTDSAKIEVIADSIGILHKNLKIITFEYYSNIKNICDSTQKMKLEQLFKEFFINDVPVGFNGRGVGGRHQGDGNGGHRRGN